MIINKKIIALLGAGFVLFKGVCLASGIMDYKQREELIEKENYTLDLPFEELIGYSTISDDSSYGRKPKGIVKTIKSCENEEGEISCKSSEQPHDINYHLYLSPTTRENIKNGFHPPVVIHVYGGGLSTQFADKHISQLAHFGVVVIDIIDEEWEKDKKNPDTHINYKNFPDQLFKDIKQVYTYFTKNSFELLENKEESLENLKPLITPSKTKVFLTGHSFGGYITMMAATDNNKETNLATLFDGFITEAGVYDWHLRMQQKIESDDYGRGNVKERNNFVNTFDFERNIEQDADQLTYLFNENYLVDLNYNKKISPAFRLKNLARPVLLLHGVRDIRVEPTQMVKLLEMARINEKDSLFRFYPIKTGAHETDTPVVSEEREACRRRIGFIEDVMTYGNDFNKNFSVSSQELFENEKMIDLKESEHERLNQIMQKIKMDKTDSKLFINYIYSGDLEKIKLIIAREKKNRDILERSKKESKESKQMKEDAQENQINEKKEVDKFISSSALYLAVKVSTPEVVEYFVRAGVDTTIRDEKTGKTFLYTACNSYSDNSSQVLKKVTDLMNEKIIKFDTYEPREIGDVLTCAIFNDSTDFLQALIKNGVNINEKNEYGKTAWMQAAISSKLDVLKILIDHGANIDEKDEDGMTALLWAAQYNEVETAEFLINHGASIYIKNNKGQTALDIAQESGNEKMKLLLEKK